MDKNTEQEWQFAASGLDAARAWLAAQPANPSDRRLAAKSTLELTDTYYDSADWMIFGLVLPCACVASARKQTVSKPRSP